MLRLRCLQRLGQAQPFASMTLAIHDELRLVSNFGFYCSATLVDGATLLNLGQSEAAVRLFTRIRALALERLGESAVPTIELSAMRSEEHTSELQSLMRISYAVFCLKKKKTIKTASKQRNTT